MPVPARRHSNLPHTRGPWDPAREFNDLQQRMGQLMDTMWCAGGLPEGLWSPPVDLEETEDGWIVEADLPGVQKGDVSIELSGSELSITGEVKERERTGVLRHRTRRTGEFEYRITLPGDADTEKIEASLDEGVLTVRVPKPERARPRKIEIRS